MNKETFKKRWEGNENGGGITFGDIKKCAIEWGISSRPCMYPMDKIRYLVLKAAGVEDAEDYKPVIIEGEK